MPTRAAVDAFIAQVVCGDHVNAIRDWYLEGATMQENQAPPRGPRDALMAREAAVLERAEEVLTELVEPPAIDGDRVAIRWRFAFRFKGGGGMRMEEIAWQRWEGDRIAEETFFYDPGQRTQAV
jgi:hypothetical protein